MFVNFRSCTDTETLLYAYQEFGLDAFSMLDGMFAVAIADLRSGRLVLGAAEWASNHFTMLGIGTVLLFASD